MAEAAERPLADGHTLALDLPGTDHRRSNALLTLLLHRLLRNAVHYSPAGGPITMNVDGSKPGG